MKNFMVPPALKRSPPPLDNRQPPKRVIIHICAPADNRFHSGRLRPVENSQLIE
jgi:hypothetical protein